MELSHEAVPLQKSKKLHPPTPLLQPNVSPEVSAYELLCWKLWCFTDFEGKGQSGSVCVKSVWVSHVDLVIKRFMFATVYQLDPILPDTKLSDNHGQSGSQATLKSSR